MVWWRWWNVGLQNGILVVLYVRACDQCNHTKFTEIALFYGGMQKFQIGTGDISKLRRWMEGAEGCGLRVDARVTAYLYRKFVVSKNIVIWRKSILDLYHINTIRFSTIGDKKLSSLFSQILNKRVNTYLLCKRKNVILMRHIFKGSILNFFSPRSTTWLYNLLN